MINNNSFNIHYTSNRIFTLYFIISQLINMMISWKYMNHKIKSPISMYFHSHSSYLYQVSTRRPFKIVKKFKSLSSTINDNDIDTIDTSHLNVTNSKISSYWIQKLQQVDRPIAKSLISQLTPKNALGYIQPTTKASKKDIEDQQFTTLVSNVLQYKETHPNMIVLVRCGDFYETYGMDAIFLVAYAGLNPMSNKCRAGCPIRNIQSTLDSLTSHGFTIAVYEEVNDLHFGTRGPEQKAKIKTRILSQIVSPGCSTYTYNLCLRADDIEFRSNRPLIGIFKSITSRSNGYCLFEIHLDEQKLVISERLCPEAIQSMIATMGCLEPIFIHHYINIQKELEFLQNYYCEKYTITSYDNNEIAQSLLEYIHKQLDVNTSNFRLTCHNYEDRPRSIYSSTALQIGLLKNENVPSLLPFLLPQNIGTYSYSNRFLRKWILNPPNHQLANHMQALCHLLSEMTLPIPRCQPILEGKAVTLLLAKQSNVILFREIHDNIQVVKKILGIGLNDSTHPFHRMLLELLPIVENEAGITMNPIDFYSSCDQVLQEIQQVIALNNTFINDLPSHDPYHRIPNDFFYQNEIEFRNKIIPISSMLIKELYQDINKAALDLCHIIQQEYPLDVEVCYDSFANSLYMKPKKKGISSK